MSQHHQDFDPDPRLTRAIEACKRCFDWTRKPAAAACLCLWGAPRCFCKLVERIGLQPPLWLREAILHCPGALVSDERLADFGEFVILQTKVRRPARAPISYGMETSMSRAPQRTMTWRTLLPDSND